MAGDAALDVFHPYARSPTLEEPDPSFLPIAQLKATRVVLQICPFCGARCFMVGLLASLPSKTFPFFLART